MTDRSERLDRLDAYIREGRLIRRDWTKEVGGRSCACLLAALSPEAGVVQNAEACPATVVPPWLASLTVWFDDAGSEAAWGEMVLRYASLARRWDVLDAAALRRLDFTARAMVVRGARTLVAEEQSSTLPAIDAVLALLDRAAQGEEIEEAEWAAARSATEEPPGTWWVTALKVTYNAACPEEDRAASAAAFELEDLARKTGATAEPLVDRITSALFDAIEREVETSSAR